MTVDCIHNGIMLQVLTIGNYVQTSVSSANKIVLTAIMLPHTLLIRYSV